MNNFTRVAVVYNPTKDFKKVELFIELALKKKADLQFDILYTENFEDIENKAHLAITKDCNITIAAGGDGTVLGVLNAAIKNNTCFSILPLGTGNDFAKSLSICDVQAAVNVLLNGSIRTVDAGVCSYLSGDGQEREMYFSSTAGVGVLAKVFSFEHFALAKALKKTLGNGVWPLLTVLSMFTSKSRATKLILNKMSIRTQMKLFEISKVQSAGGMYFTPFAGTENGFFDAWMLHDAGSFRYLDVFLKADQPGGNHFSCEGFSYFSSADDLNRYNCSKLTDITIIPDKVLPVHLNGDVVGYTPCCFSLLPKKLKVLA